MRNITSAILGGHIANAVAGAFGGSRLVRGGTAAMVARIAGRSFPALIAVAGVGAALSYAMNRKKRREQAANSPAGQVIADTAQGRAPDPRRHYDTPAQLLADETLSPETREELLSQWKDEVDYELASEAEGMGMAIDAPADDVGLAAEARKVNKALTELRENQPA